MGIFVIILVLVIIVILVITNNSSDNSKTKKNEEYDYNDNQIIEQTLNHNNSLRNQQALTRTKSSISRIDIEKYHPSNEVICNIQSEYVKLYHESEGPVSYIDPTEVDEYRQRFRISIWNSQLGVKEQVIGCTVEQLVSQCEKQFREWADKVEKKKRIKTQTSSEKSDVIAQQRKIPDMIFEVKGLTYRSAQAQLEAVLLEIGDLLLLEEEPDNEVDASAVKVLTQSGECIGYVDKEHCVSVGALINLIDSCTVMKKSRHQIPYITAKISFKE